MVDGLDSSLGCVAALGFDFAFRLQPVIQVPPRDCAMRLLDFLGSLAYAIFGVRLVVFDQRCRFLLTRCRVWNCCLFSL